MLRPQPPLNALHFFAPENEEEKTLRSEMGFTSSADVDQAASAEMDIDGALEVDGDDTPDREPPAPSIHFSDDSRQTVPHVISGKQGKDRIEEPNVRDSAPLAPIASDPPSSAIIPSPPPAMTRPQPVVASTAYVDDGFLPFISAPTYPALDKGKAKAVEPEMRGRQDSNSPMPELDSGSSDFGDLASDEEGSDEEEEG